MVINLLFYLLNLSLILVYWGINTLSNIYLKYKIKIDTAKIKYLYSFKLSPKNKTQKQIVFVFYFLHL